MKYFTCSVKIKREVDNGKTKTYNENYLVCALSITEVETLVYKFMEDCGEKDFKVASAKESRILEVIGHTK